MFALRRLDRPIWLVLIVIPRFSLGFNFHLDFFNDMDGPPNLNWDMEMETPAGPSIKILTEKALEANKAHQYALTKYAERLTADLQEMDKLLVCAS